MSMARSEDVKVDETLDATGLAAEISALLREAEGRDRWYLVEKCEDRGRQPPRYILEFRDSAPDPGSATWDETLFQSSLSGVSVKHLARTGERQGPYWLTVGPEELKARLERFFRMYLDDYLQPPGERGPGQLHTRLQNTKFHYQLCSPAKRIAGIGSRRFAPRNAYGAVCGRLLHTDGRPLSGVEVELSSTAAVFRRTTDADGRFWISRAPPGPYRLRVSAMQLRMKPGAKDEPFGAALGAQTSWPSSSPSTRTVLLEAPDGEVFRAFTDSAGRFDSGPLPAFAFSASVEGEDKPQVREKPRAGDSTGGTGALQE